MRDQHRQGDASETPPAETPDADPSTGTDPVRCPACDTLVRPEHERCSACGTALEAAEGTPLALWEYGGALAAMFGIFLTPILTGPVALYCAFRLYSYKPRAALGIVAVVAATVVFWIVLPVLLLP